MANKVKNYLSTREAAERLSVAISTVQLWTDNGLLHGWTTAGGHRRINKTSVDEMLLQQKMSDEVKENREYGNNKILEQIAMGKPLQQILQCLIAQAEVLFPGAICSILFLDKSGRYLIDGVAPALPDFYNEAIDRLEIGMGVGSCGEAAYSGKRVIVSDTMTHANWSAFKELAIKADLHACWSEPFLSASGTVLGTFAFYFSEKKAPADTDIGLLVELAHYASIAVERDRSQKTLMKAKEAAESASTAKSQFLSSMSHELRTPMNAVIGFTQLLKMAKPSLTELQDNYVTEIMAASNHLMLLINEVLDLAKIESGDFELSMNKVCLDQMIKESICLVLPSAQERDIDIELIKNGVKISLDDIAEFEDFAWLDETCFKQVILNLLSNAVKYNNEQGKIILSYEKTSKKLFRISITDTGNGLSKEQQSNLFESFNRLGLEQSDIPGTGIGLVITKKIVDVMSGKIGFDSEVGIGSTFWVELPVKESVERKQHRLCKKNVKV